MTMNESQAAGLLERALAESRAEHTQVSLSAGSEGSTRFANNAITQNVADTNAALSVSAAFGNCVGRARTNDLSDDGLARVVRQAEEIARASEPDTEYLPPLGPQKYLEVEAHAQTTAECSPARRAKLVETAVAVAAERGLRSAGSVATHERLTVLANSNGLRAAHRSTSSRLVVTAMTDSSSGWAQASGIDVGALDAGEVARRAVGKAEACQDPEDVAPESYTVVLEPAAVADLLSYLVYSMDAKSADEGRSAFAGQAGTILAGQNVTLRSDPTHADCPGAPFGGGGMPAQRRVWIDQGRVASLIYSRFWAQKTGHEQTGFPANLIMDGDTASVEELVTTVDRGLLITRFWYIRHVDPMKLLLTGMTRDGTFLIEDGAVKHGVTNMRFNFSPLDMLRNIERLGAAQRGRSSSFVPPLVVKDFQFSSGTSF